MFLSKVYKECYPFTREVLYDKEKQKLFVKLLRNRKIDLEGLKRETYKQFGRKYRKRMLLLIEREYTLLSELEKKIHDKDYMEVEYNYPNWLLKKYRLFFSAFFWRGIILTEDFYDDIQNNYTTQ